MDPNRLPDRCTVFLFLIKIFPVYSQLVLGTLAVSFSVPLPPSSHRAREALGIMAFSTMVLEGSPHDFLCQEGVRALACARRYVHKNEYGHKIKFPWGRHRYDFLFLRLHFSGHVVESSIPLEGRLGVVAGHGQCAVPRTAVGLPTMHMACHGHCRQPRAGAPEIGTALPAISRVPTLFRR